MEKEDGGWKRMGVGQRACKKNREGEEEEENGGKRKYGLKEMRREKAGGWNRRVGKRMEERNKGQKRKEGEERRRWNEEILWNRQD